jgi:hypothetical protein
MAPGGKAFIIFNFPPGVLFSAADEVGDLLCPGRNGPAWRAGLSCVLNGVAVCLAIVRRASRATALPPAANWTFLRPRAALAA